MTYLKIKEIVRKQHDWLKMLQGEYRNTPILIKAKEGAVEDGDDPDLYRWLPFYDIWHKIRNPIYTRGILPNEIFIDPDIENWQTMRSGIVKLLEYCEEAKIPITECAYSGGKGIHVSIFIAPFSLHPELEQKIRATGIDYMQIIRETLFKDIFKDAGISPESIGVDLKKIHFSKDRMGSMVRCFGALRKDGRYKTQIDPDKIPEYPPLAEDLTLRIPDEIPKWKIEDTEFHRHALKVLNQECLKAEQRVERPSTRMDADLGEYPCVQRILNLASQIPAGPRYYAAQAIVLRGSDSGVSQAESKKYVTEFIDRCSGLTTNEKQVRIEQSVGMWGAYHFSCSTLKSVLGDGVCVPQECPLIQKLNENKTLPEEDISKTPVTADKWPQCIHRILNEENPTDPMLQTLGAFLGQMGIPQDEAEILYDMTGGDITIFQGSYRKLRTASCEKVQQMGVCQKDPWCMNVPSPRYRADRNANADRLKSKLKNNCN